MGGAEPALDIRIAPATSRDRREKSRERERGLIYRPEARSLMEFSSGSSSEDSARPFHLEVVDRGQFLCKQSCRSLVVEESFSPGGRLAETAFFAPQATEHDINILMD